MDETWETDLFNLALDHRRRRWMNMVSDDYDVHDTQGRMWSIFPDILRKTPGKSLREETDPTGDITRARRMIGSDVTPRPIAVVTILQKEILYCAGKNATPPRPWTMFVHTTI